MTEESEHDWEWVGLGWTCQKCQRWMNRTGHTFEAVEITGVEHVELFGAEEARCPERPDGFAEQPIPEEHP